MSFNVTVPDLTPAEWRVVLVVSQDYSYKEIAGKLTICLETVKQHRKNISRKLGVSGKTAFRRAIRQLVRDGVLPFTP